MVFVAPGQLKESVRIDGYHDGWMAGWISGLWYVECRHLSVSNVYHTCLNDPGW